MKNPFLFGSAVSGDAFYDRDEIGRRLFRAVENGTNVLLYGPRRYGKTSLAGIVAEKLRAEGHQCIFFDMMKVNSMEQFLQAYANAAFSIQSRASKSLAAMSRFFRGLRPKLAIGKDGEPSLEMDFSSDPATPGTLEEVLSLPEAVENGGKNVVVIFDEFQEIGRLSAEMPAERIFRSVIQRQKRVNYVFLGSRTHLLKRMFTDAARPFYQSALVLEMEKPPRSESLDFLRDRFRHGGMHVGETALEKIVEASENIPYYLQALAYEVFETADSDGRREATERDVEAALSGAVRRMRDVFETTVENLSEVQRTLLSALAAEPAAAFDAAYRRRNRLPSYASIASAMRVLVSKGLVETSRKSRRVADPFLAAYLREPVCSTS